MRATLFLLLLIIHISGNAQDLAFGKKMVDTLSSSAFWGRGYTKDGMKKAANFLASQFKEYKLLPLNGNDYFQHYTFSINTFPGKMSVRINDRLLVPGRDYIVAGSSKGMNASGTLIQSDSIHFIDKNENLIVKLSDKLTMGISQTLGEFSIVEVKKNSLQDIPQSYSIQIENKYLKKFNANNICAYVEGIERPDSFIFITAHYDHLGGLGSEVFFPGANDNASGVALLMNLARYYAKNPQKYSIGFILFSGEEAGLVGSKYFTENPLISLGRIRFLINTDLAGTGIDGITVVNASEFPKELTMMKAVNDSMGLLKVINSRGKAANSDHYFFTESGVPSFFFYTLGGVSYYHDVFDRSETLPLNEHEDLFKLIIGFNEKLMGQ
ncbi:MAG: M28 family peptidase [Bacteroidetes bacterium]|nr:M28 family peptidase [Bacteroidota bacterium]MBK9524221.1 M28 family peptidase [Bacteroidota bacterium]MBK9541957.1 M28 family peptidase [Bacteroidota bacterium]